MSTERIIVLLESVKGKLKSLKRTPKVMKPGELPKMQDKPNQHNAHSASAAKTALAKLKAKGKSSHKVKTTKSSK